VEANGLVLQKVPPILKTTLSALRDADSLGRLSRGAPEDLEVLCDRIGVQYRSAEINGARMKLRKKLEQELRSWLKSAARKEEERSVDSEIDSWAIWGVPDDANDGQRAELKAARKREKMENWEVKWGKDYDENVESKMGDEDLRLAEHRR
jgi:hypothetical protein